jgi:hypothetical protein
MGISAVVAAVGAAATYVSHKDAKSAQADQQAAMAQQQAQGEVALGAQSDALAQQKIAADAALAQQRLIDQGRVDQANAALAQQKSEFDKTFAASQEQAAAQLRATALTNDLNMKAASQAADAQKEALSAQVAAADRLYKQQTEAMNKANQKQPDTAAITAENKANGKSGQSGTMLTGPTGIDMNSLLLGKNTLLGG